MSEKNEEENWSRVHVDAQMDGCDMKNVLWQQLFLPKFLKFWTPPHDFALVIGSFEFLGCILSFYE